MPGKFFCGTSGYAYYHWVGKFYPQDLPREKWLEYYAQYFNTVEINYTFYHMPRESTVEKWRRQCPENFLMVLKASRLITHYYKKNLESASFLLGKFLKLADILGEHRGPVLMQFPPSFADHAVLDEFLSRIKPEHRVAMEFRNRQFLEDEAVREKLAAHNVAFCVYSWPRFGPVFAVTADFVYIRFHGAKRLYASSYSREELVPFADFARAQLAEGRDVFAFFNNDAEGYAVDNALTFREMVTS